MTRPVFFVAGVLNKSPTQQNQNRVVCASRTKPHKGLLVACSLSSLAHHYPHHHQHAPARPHMPDSLHPSICCCCCCWRKPPASAAAISCGATTCLQKTFSFQEACKQHIRVFLCNVSPQVRTASSRFSGFLSPQARRAQQGQSQELSPR